VSKKQIKNGEMTAISAPLVDPKSEVHALILGIPQAAGVLPALQSAHTGLLQLEHPTESAIARRISEDEVNVDASHDALARGFDSGMTAAMSLTKDPDLRAQIARVHDLLLPDGVAMVNNTYLDESGAAQARKAKMTADVKALLKKVPTPESNMLKVVEEWNDAGEALGELEARKQQELDRLTTGPSRTDNVLARNKWIRATNALASMIELAEAPEDVAQKILGQLRAVELKAARRGVRKQDVSPADPKPPVDPKPEP
jgi:hypothetical protein